MSNSTPDKQAHTNVDKPDMPDTLGDTKAYTPTEGGVTDFAVSTDDPFIGSSIGRYRLLKKLGEGGMGAVYLAEQSEPVKRLVALKLIRGNFDSRTIIARFEAERQALAVMDHPNIARIYDGGTTSSHHPFFVMELVQGVPITEYCDQHRLSPKQRLELFVPICQAVQHAHQKGIIHRDLKPSNVLVTEVDGKPIPKVIDFGVAKATEQPLTDQSLGDTGAIVGTPMYMSPEQADPESMDIDTRTDIYALGVMLYELLTGSPPIDARQFKRGAVLEVLRMVREVDPPRPSTKLSTAEGLPSIAANRNIEPKQLQAMLRGDIDWIVMKAIEKDRARRYETANGFAADVQRFLAGEAVLAHPPGRWYLLKKFVRRNRGQVIAAGLVVGVLAAGLVVSLWQMNRAIQAEAQAIHESDLKEKQRQTAVRRLSQIEKGVELLASILKGINPRTEENGGPSVYELLQQRVTKAADALDEESVSDLIAVSRLQAIMGETLQELGNTKKAIEVLCKAEVTQTQELGADHQDTLNTQNILAVAFMASGNAQRSLELLEHVKNGRTIKLGADHPDTITTQADMASAYLALGKLPEAISNYEEVRTRFEAHFGKDHPFTLTAMNNLAGAYKQAGRIIQALQLLEQSRDLVTKKMGAEHADTLNAISNLAMVYLDAGKTTPAIELLEEVSKVRARKLGHDHPSTLTTENNLALALYKTGKSSQAIELFKQVRASRERKLGASHPSTLNTMSNLASAYMATAQPKLAVELLEKVRAFQVKDLEPDHPSTLTTLNNLASAYQATGNPLPAIEILEKVRVARVKKLGADHPSTLIAINNLASAYRRGGKLAQSIELYEQVLPTIVQKQGSDHPSTIVVYNGLASAYQEDGKLDQAINLFDKALSGLEKRNFQFQNASTILSQAIKCYEQAEKWDKGEKWRRQWQLLIQKQNGADSYNYAIGLTGLGLNLLRQAKWTKAEEIFRESLRIHEKLGPAEWVCYNAKSLIGEALLGQKKYAEAETLLLQGYSGLKQKEASIAPNLRWRISEAADRLIQLYTETNKPDQVKKWQAEKAKLAASELKK